MLSPSSPSTQSKQAPAVISGLRLAKSTRGYPVEVRAVDAARWLRREAEVRPTAKLACAVFGISYCRLKQAQTRLGHVNGSGGRAPISDRAVRRFILKAGADRIRLLLAQQAGKSELPLVAAE